MQGITQWEVVTVFVFLVGFAISLVTPIVKLNGSITKLTVLLERNSKDINCLGQRQREHEQTIHDHETRIQMLEKVG